MNKKIEQSRKEVERVLKPLIGQYVEVEFTEDNRGIVSFGKELGNLDKLQEEVEDLMLSNDNFYNKCPLTQISSIDGISKDLRLTYVEHMFSINTMEDYMN